MVSLALLCAEFCVYIYISYYIILLILYSIIFYYIMFFYIWHRVAGGHHPEAYHPTKLKSQSQNSSCVFGLLPSVPA